MHDIKDFYEKVVITNNMSGAKSNWTSSIQHVIPATSALGDDTNFIVLVHGINVRDWDCLNDAETVLKRLYWAGYQGKFAEVKWPCNLLTPIPDPLTLEVFNQSEFQAYKASTALTNYIGQLHNRFSGYRLNILAHSQGNAIVSEAIKQGMPFDTYILTQGAIPDSAYDVNAPTDSGLMADENTYGPTPENAPWGYRGIYTNSYFAGKIVNFFNTNDPVLKIWISDQASMKPQQPTTPYAYDGSNGWYDVVFGSYMVTDPQESRAFVSRSRTLAIGLSPPETAHGVIKSGIDLHTRFGFDKALPDDHSAQWTWPIQTTYLYYKQILLQIPPTP